MDLTQFEQDLLRDPKFRKEYEKFDLAFEIGQMVSEARIIKGITQKRLATMIKTKQSSIARLESGNSLPSLRFLKKIAGVLKTYVIVKFGFMDGINIDCYSYSNKSKSQNIELRDHLYEFESSKLTFPTYSIINNSNQKDFQPTQGGYNYAY